MVEIITIINQDENILAYLNDVKDGKLIKEINGEFTLNFTALIDPIKTDFLYDDGNLLNYGNDYFRVARLEELHNENNMLLVSVYAEHVSYDLIKNTTPSFIYDDKAAIYVMNEALTGTNFLFTGTDVLTTASIELTEGEPNDLNIKKILHNIALVWGGELEYFRWNVGLKQSLGINRGVDFRFGKNIKNIKRIINYIEDEVAYDVNIVQGSEYDELGYYVIGDTVKIIDDALDIELNARIVKVEKDIVADLNNRVILGYAIKDLSSGLQGTLNRTRQTVAEINGKVSDVIDINGNLIAEKLTGTINSSVASVTNSTGHVSFDARGIIVHDQPLESNSTWAVLISSGGILLSNARDGLSEWIWRTAITGDAISADEITTGTLTAINIDGVHITSSRIDSNLIIVESGVEKSLVEYTEGVVADSGAVMQKTAYNSVVIDAIVGVKASHTDGSYTQLSGSGLLRNLTLPVYTKSATGVANSENFNTKTKAQLETDGWFFYDAVSVVSGELQLGSTDVGLARKLVYITDDSVSMSFKYRVVSTASNVGYRFFVDDTTYTLAKNTTQTTYTVTVNKGWHLFAWDCTLAVSSPFETPTIFLDDVVFEPDMQTYTQTSTYEDERQYSFVSYVGQITVPGSVNLNQETYIADLAIELPDEFKGKDFKIILSVASTPIMSSYSLAGIKTEVLDIDYTNATFLLRGKAKWISGSNTMWTGLTVNYLATY